MVTRETSCKNFFHVLTPTLLVFALISSKLWVSLSLSLSLSLTSEVSGQPCRAVRGCLHCLLPQELVAKTRTANPSMTWNGDEQVQLVDTRGIESVEVMV